MEVIKDCGSKKEVVLVKKGYEHKKICGNRKRFVEAGKKFFEIKGFLKGKKVVEVKIMAGRRKYFVVGNVTPQIHRTYHCTFG